MASFFLDGAGGEASAELAFALQDLARSKVMGSGIVFRIAACCLQSMAGNKWPQMSRVERPGFNNWSRELCPGAILSGVQWRRDVPR